VRRRVMASRRRSWVIEAEKGKPGTEIGLLCRELSVLGITLRAEEAPAPAKKSAADATDIDAILAKARKSRR